jgi:glycosyltransferase involved in cell wall biosynthesis
VFFSVVIPTYNRKPVLEKCLTALEAQVFTPDSPIECYELVVVDDGSTDGTVEWLHDNPETFPHVRVVQQAHKGIAEARNLGVTAAAGDVIVFIDSDVFVLPDCLNHHGLGLHQAMQQGNPQVFTYGQLINTCDFDAPMDAKLKVTDFSAAFFETNNVAIAKHWLVEAGLFDTQFTQYGWEDLEMGVRLKNMGLTVVKCPAAIGYHWHAPFSVAEIPSLIEKEIQRGRMGVVFYQKHPSWNVRMMIQMTWIHQLLWGLLTLGGRLNEKTMTPLLEWIVNQGKPQLAQEIARIFLNWYNVQGVYAAYAELQQDGLKGGSFDHRA